MTDLDMLDQPYQPRTFELWGQAFFSPRKFALVKGKGKVDFDPAVHKDMIWGADLSIIPIEEQGARIAERTLLMIEKEWGLIQSSIVALGVKVSDVDQRYVHVKFEPTGETYTNAAGELKNKTYIKFLQVFPSESECKLNFMAQRGDDITSADTEPEDAGKADLPAARMLLANLARTASKGKTTLAEVQAAAEVRLKASAVMAKYFTVQHPDFIALVVQELDDQKVGA